MLDRRDRGPTPSPTLSHSLTANFSPPFQPVSLSLPHHSELAMVTTTIDPTELQHRPSPEPTHRLNPKLRLAASSPNIKALFDGAPPSLTHESSHQQSPSHSARRVLEEDPLPPFYSPPASAGLSLLPTTNGISSTTPKERTLHHQHSLSFFPTSTSNSSLSSTSKTNGSSTSSGAVGDFSSWKSLRPIVSRFFSFSTAKTE